MTTSRYTYLFNLILVGFLFCQCGEPEEPTIECVPDDFVLAGVWKFDFIAGEGVIFGVPQSDQDEDPEGTVEFFDFGQGISSVRIELLGGVIEKVDEDIDWRWLSCNELRIEEEDGAEEIWQITKAEENNLEAEWDINIAGNTATITARLSRM